MSALSEENEVSASDDLAARTCALGVLESILKTGKELDAAFANDDFNRLPLRDRAFTRMLVSTTLRRMGQIDDLIRKSEDKPGGERSLGLQNLLRIGAAQLMFMGVPDHAAVDTTVRIADKSGFSKQKNFVNAILRTIARSGQEWLSRQDEARINVPEWLMRIWIEDYGLRTAAEISLASLAEAPLDITVKNPGMRDYWAGELEATVLPTGSLRRNSGGKVSDLPGFDDGMWWIQDAGAALPARLLGDITDQTVIDLCAAPGGKTAQLAMAGADVIAIDRSRNRLVKFEENIKRLKLEQHVASEAADATVWKPSVAATHILLDAPCTATGTIRRNPDILHTKEPRDLERLVNLQATLLESAVNMLAPCGVLIYCTCSLQKAEGEYQIERLLQGGAHVSRLPVSPEEIGGIEGAVTENGDVRLLPFHLSAYGGVDGFFISRLVKAGN
jgi:16S rRNA (cytosine967-C5)-methyltransferase